MLSTVKFPAILRGFRLFFILGSLFAFPVTTSAQTAVSAQISETVFDVNKCKLTSVLTNEGIGTKALSGGESHCYKITLDADQYVRFLVQQKGIDVFLQLFDENGNPLTEIIDSPNGIGGFEPIAVAFKGKSKYILRISNGSGSTGGNYSITLDEQRKIRESDFVFAEVEPVFLQGEVALKSTEKDLNKAQQYYEKVWPKLENLETLSPSQSEVRVVLAESSARTYFEIGKNDQARQFAEIQVKLESGRKVSSMIPHYILGRFYQAQNNIDRAISEYDIVAASFRANLAASEINDEKIIMFNDTESRRGELYWFVKKDIVKGSLIFEEMADVQRSLHQANEAAYSLATAGAYNFDRGLISRAREYYQKALEEKGLDDPWVLAFIYANRGVALSVKGNFDEALKSFEKVETYAEENAKKPGRSLDKKALAYARHGRAIVYTHLNNFDRAMELCKLALEISSPGGKVVYPDAAAFEHLYLGRILTEKGDKVAAENEFLEAIKIWERSTTKAVCADDPRLCIVAKRGSANAINNIGEIYYQSGDKVTAYEKFEEALKIQNSIEVPLGKDRVLTNMAILDADKGDFSTAIRHLDEALIVSQGTGDRLNETSVLAGFAKVAQMQGKPADSLEKLAQLREIVEEIRKIITDDDLREGYFSTQQKIFDLYENVLMQQGEKTRQRQYAEKALEISESYKARRLYDTIVAGGIKIRRNISPELEAREKELKDKLALLVAQSRLLSKDTGKVSGTFASDIDLTVSELGKVRSQIKEADRHFAEFSDPEPLNWAQIQKNIPSNTLAIEFYVGGEKTYVWAFNSTGPIHSYEVNISRGRLQEKIESLLTVIKQQEESRITNESYKNLSLEISNLLLGQIPKEMWKPNILIVPDHSLQYCPFSALPFPSSDNREWEPLIVQYEIANAPSVTSLSGIKPGRSTAPKAFMGFIAPKYAPKQNAAAAPTGSAKLGFPVKPLVFGESDLVPALKRIAGKARLSAKDYKLYRNSDVNRKNLTSAEMRQYKYLLIYAHGRTDETEPARSGIYLSGYDINDRAVPDFFFGLNDLVNQELTADVVLLGACETALGKNISGEGVVGLTRGFMYSGSKSVIAPLWEVDEFWSEHLVEEFSSKLLVEKRLPNAALREVQREMWTKHKLPPYYWAGFQFNGRSH